MGDVIQFAEAAMRRRIQRAERAALEAEELREENTTLRQKLRSLIEPQKDFRKRVRSLVDVTKPERVYNALEALEYAADRLPHNEEVSPPGVIVIVRSFEKDCVRTRHIMVQVDGEMARDMLESVIGATHEYDENDTWDDDDPFGNDPFAA
jgi:hypothetical protein